MKRKILSHGGHDRVTKVMWSCPFPECLQQWHPWERKGSRGDVNSRNHSEKWQGGRRAQLPVSSRNLPWRFLCSQPLPFYSGTCLILTSTSEAQRGKQQQRALGQGQADRTAKAANTAAGREWVKHCPTLSHKPVSSSSPGLSLLPVPCWLLPNPIIAVVSYISSCRSLLGAIPELGYTQGCSGALRDLLDLPHFVSETPEVHVGKLS